MLIATMLAGALAAATCESLTSMSAREITITSAAIVAAGPPQTAGAAAAGRGRGQAPAASAAGRGSAGRASAVLPEYCRVAAVLAPSSDSHIEMELWMPTTTWNGKFQAVGNGGWAGAISFDAMQTALRAGYATASTDTGHKGPQASAAFAVAHPEKVTDFAWRAIHEMTVKSKALIAAFYEKPARLSYFNGCSTGGRQGLMSAQRFPDDFDGIVSGAPVYNQLHLSASQLQRQVDVIRDPAKRLSPDKITLLAKAVVNACDANDGVTDGIVSRPDRCSFSPRALACKGPDSPDCLTAAQVDTVERAYAPMEARTGAAIYPGSSRGFESGMRMPEVPIELHFSAFREVGRQDAKWDPMSFDLEKDLALVRMNAPTLEANDPNLARFKARGGKLLLYHGWADPGPAPLNTLAYYAAVEKTLGGSQDGWMRLFLMPGVGHCAGGVGPDQADFVGALDRWRDVGQAPASIEASKITNGAVTMTRPLCAHPQVAVYNGAGATSDAANFSCRNP
jgi:feruloyl esterase